MRRKQSSRIRIVVVAHSFAVPSNRARWERMAERHPDTQLTLVTPASSRTNHLGEEQAFRPQPETHDNYSLRPIPTTIRGFYQSATLSLHRLSPHVLQVNEEPTEWSVLQLFLAARALAPRALRLFYYYTNLLDPPRRWHHSAKLSATFALADGAFAGSSDAESVLRELGLRRPVWIQTELGVDERVWTPGGARRDGRPFTVGFVGALKPHKGVADLVKAMAGVTGSWHLVVIGDGPERAHIESAARAAGFADRVDMRGMIDRNLLPPVVREFDVLVLPSRTMPPQREQFGLVLAEAMQSGVAVVGSDSGAIPEVIDVDGLIFPEGDWMALRQHLQTLADNPSFREDLARRGRERALRLWSATALADQTYDLYREMVARGRAVGR